MEGTFGSGPTVVVGNFNEPARCFGSKDVIFRACLCISVENEDCGLATQIGVQSGRMAGTLRMAPHIQMIFRRIARPCEAARIQGCAVAQISGGHLEFCRSTWRSSQTVTLHGECELRGVAGAKPTDGKMGWNPKLMTVFRLGQNGVLGSTMGKAS
ncbi:hypothetical protein JTB14_019311 [Gonioctena quinquepunctata]|nr:hypothetical protein JTB14_019311 [Gonioctena quinquepunctata]